MGGGGSTRSSFPLAFHWPVPSFLGDDQGLSVPGWVLLRLLDTVRGLGYQSTTRTPFQTNTARPYCSSDSIQVNICVLHSLAYDDARGSNRLEKFNVVAISKSL